MSFPKPFVKNPYKKRISSGVFECFNSINNSVTQLSNKHHKPNEDGDILGKQRTEGFNKYFVLNKNIKLPFEKKNEEKNNYNLTTKELYQMNKNLVTEKLCDKNIKMCTKHVSNGFVSKLPKNDSHFPNQSYTLKLNNTRKSYNLIPSCKGNFKVKICPVNNKLTLEKSNKSKAIVATVTATLDIELLSEAIVATVTEWNDLYPSLLKHYSMRKVVHISRHTITQLIKHFYQEKRNNVILDSNSIIEIYSFLFPETNYISDAKELFNHIKSNDKYNKTLYNVLSNKDNMNVEYFYVRVD